MGMNRRQPAVQQLANTDGDLSSRRLPQWQLSVSVSFMSAAGLLAAMGALLTTEDLTGITLFPAALLMLALAGIALASGLSGLTMRIRRDHQRRGRIALIGSGLGAVGGILLAVMIPVGLATGGLSGDAPASVDRLAAMAMLALVAGTCVGATATGISVWKSAIPSRAVGAALTATGLLFLVPLGVLVTDGARPQAVIVALFATWMVLFGGIGLALRRE